jgi:hypothetical protein
VRTLEEQIFSIEWRNGLPDRGARTARQRTQEQK